MILQRSQGRLSSTIAGSRAVRTAVAAFSLLAISASSVWAQAEAQAEIDASLITLETGTPLHGRTILNTTAAELAKGVASAILTNTDASLTPADIAIAAIEPVIVNVVTRTGTTMVPVVRPDRNASAPAVTAAAITELAASDTDATVFSDDVAALTGSMVEVNGTNPAQDLSIPGKEGVVLDALLAVSDAASAATSAITPANLLLADKAIGTALASDPALESLVVPRDPNAFIGILQVGMLGIDGARGTSQTVIPQAAANFVTGIIDSGTIPDGVTVETFAADILKYVWPNTHVDELVANAVGASLGASNTDGLVTLSNTLFKTYPAAAVKVAQGITAVASAVNVTESNRVSLVNAMTAETPADAVAVADGATYVDPFFAGPFVQSVFNALIAADPDGTARVPFPPLALKDSAAIALGVGSILGQNGDVLTNVADVFATLTGDNILPVVLAPTYATDLIAAAVTSKVPAFTGGGGKLNLTAPIMAPELTDLESIGDLFANAIITSHVASANLDTVAGAAAAAAEIGALSGDIARFLAHDTSMIGDPQYVAAALAGSIANTVASLASTDPTLTTLFALGRTQTDAQNLILASIAHDVELVSSRAVAIAVGQLITSGSYTEDGVVGELSVQETAITNL